MPEHNTSDTQPRELRPSERRPTGPMLTALRRALQLERGPQGEPWVHHRHHAVAPACERRGLASEYRVHPTGQVYYRITDAGRRAVGAEVLAASERRTSAVAA